MAVSDLSSQNLQYLLDRALYFSQNQDSTNFLKGKTVALLFFENSTRTRISFEMAAKKLGAHVIVFEPQSSSLNKGESVYDTVKTIEAIGANVCVIRHPDDHLFDSLKNQVQISLVNAGAGKKEHPSQALLDLYTLWKEFGGLKDKTITICGDIKYSRVAQSNISSLTKMGAKIILSGPEILLPSKLEQGCEVMDFDKAIPISDAVMMLRIQTERHIGLEVSKQDYLPRHGLTKERKNKMKENAIIMHPAPVNRGVEIDSDLVECDKSRIFNQVTNGVYMRMAILDWLIRGENA